MSTQYIDIRIYADKLDLEEFLEFCGAVQYLGEVGAHRELQLSIDGDGSARFKFFIGDEQLPSTKLDTGHKDVFKFFIGE